MKSRLEDFFGERAGEVNEKPSSKSEDVQKNVVDEWVSYFKGLTVERCVNSKNLKNVYLFSASYDGDKRCVVLKFYNPEDKKIYFWCDTTGHKPYCLTNITPEELENIPELKEVKGLDHFEVVEKFSLLMDKPLKVTKIVAQDPLTIGGKPSGSVRDVLPKIRHDVKVWEADIKYYECYIYDLGLDLGLPYNIEDGIPVKNRLTNTSFEVEKLFTDEPKEFFQYLRSWSKLLETPLPDLKFAALDIEVESPGLDRVPDPKEALHRVICASIVDSDGVKHVLLLRRSEVKDEEFDRLNDAKVEFYDDETQLLCRIFRFLVEYPIIVTFNGDEFDLKYLYHRAQKLGFQREVVPIQLTREYAYLPYSVHIDLYRFFFNKAIQVYAFDQKYREVNLHDISLVFLGLGKVELSKNVSELDYKQLATYCLRDSELTFKLASFDGNLVLKLIIALARITRMILEDVSRQSVSNWIKSLMYWEHRRNNYLIPSSEEILAVKGSTSTHSIIKGKKYRGAIVIEPKPGVNFNVVVLDFNSLYPSIIKKWNLSYETVKCSHEECKVNLIPETNYWVCKRRQGLTSLVIGSLRDLRVKWYKAKAKDKTLPEEVRVWYSVVQRTLKVILNASYGVFGAEHFALYCPLVAEATASIGRYAIKTTIKKAEELGIEVIYGDTDSMFLKNPSEEQVEALIEWSKNVLGMELDVDKQYRYSVFSTRKKNYIGVYHDGNVEIKGLTGKKRNTPEFLKKTFVEMIKILGEVKSEDDFDKAREKIKSIVKDCYVRLKNRQYSLEELAFTVVLGKDVEDYDKTTPQHVKALKLLPKKEKVDVGAGSVIRYVKVRREPGVKLITHARMDEVDVEKYVEHIQTTFEQVLDALGLSFNEITGMPREAKLEFFQ